MIIFLLAQLCFISSPYKTLVAPFSLHLLYEITRVGGKRKRTFCRDFGVQCLNPACSHLFDFQLLDIVLLQMETIR